MISAAFVASSLLVIMTPGPDLALVTQLRLTRSGAAPAVAAVAGMITAAGAQVSIGALGMAALLAAEPGLFTALRWAGAAVLLGMGLLALRAALRPPAAEAVVPQANPPGGRAFLRGFVCTGTNPKVGLFLMAFLPQFVPLGVPAVVGLAVLATVYLGLVVVWLLTWIALVGRIARFVHAPAVARVANALIAVVFGYFAVRMLLG